MILTEEEYRHKWCPHVRLAASAKGKDFPGANRAQSEIDFVHNPPGARCIASECSQWRWATMAEIEVNSTWPISNPPDGWRYNVSFDDGTSQFERVRSDGPKGGYCGLAGKP